MLADVISVHFPTALKRLLIEEKKIYKQIHKEDFIALSVDCNKI